MHLSAACAGLETDRRLQRVGYARALAALERQDAAWYAGMAGGVRGVVPGSGPDERGTGREDTAMRATVEGTVIAEAPESELVKIEGNWYFPPSAITPGVLSESPTPYTCPWKGACQYWDVVTPAGTRKDGAWSYPDLRPGAVERVGTDFTGYVAFSPGITVAG